jgi:hypothetical protein
VVDALGRGGEALHRLVGGKLSGGGGKSSSELREMVLGCRKPKLAGLRSTSGSRQSSGCTGSGLGGDVDGCRRWLEMAAEAG